MSEVEEARLQHEIDAILQSTDTACDRITLGNGSDVTDLSRCLDVDVLLRGAREYVNITIVTGAWMVELLQSHAAEIGELSPPFNGPHFCVRGGLCVVQETSARTVVSAAMRWLYVNGYIQHEAR
jgi:hypothetical protein